MRPGDEDEEQEEDKEVAGTGANGDGDEEEDKDCVPRRPARPRPLGIPSATEDDDDEEEEDDDPDRGLTAVPRRADRGPTSGWRTSAGASPSPRRCFPLAAARVPRCPSPQRASPLDAGAR